MPNSFLYFKLLQISRTFAVVDLLVEVTGIEPVSKNTSIIGFYKLIS